VPAAHCEHVELPTLEKDPAAHERQDAEEVLPTTALYLPATHCVQDGADTALCVPAAQTSHELAPLALK
jgi:hypothetical protein